MRCRGYWHTCERAIAIRGRHGGARVVGDIISGGRARRPKGIMVDNSTRCFGERDSDQGTRRPRHSDPCKSIAAATIGDSIAHNQLTKLFFTPPSRPPSPIEEILPQIYDDATRLSPDIAVQSTRG
jgi:hypothetical protein